MQSDREDGGRRSGRRTAEKLAEKRSESTVKVAGSNRVKPGQTGNRVGHAGQLKVDDELTSA